MKIKAVEIAKALGVSKATVSLALNDKPGVSAETKKRILDYIHQMESGIDPLGAGSTIRIILFSHNYALHPKGTEDIFTPVIRMFAEEAKKDGLTLTLDDTGNTTADIQRSIKACESDDVKGVILFATFMTKDDFEPFKAIKKPMVIYDNDFEDPDYTYVKIDNGAAVRLLVDHFHEQGYDDIQYWANDYPLFNFTERRAMFRMMSAWNGKDPEIIMGGADEEGHYTKFMEAYKQGTIRQALLVENYQASAAILRAFHDMGIGKLPFAIAAIDELTPYYMYGRKLTYVRISHDERACLAMDLLRRQMRTTNPDRFKLLSNCHLVVGDTSLSVK